MTDPSSMFFLFAIGGVSGFLNVMAGGGSTIVLPALILMGMDGTLANGTNRVALLMQNISAVASFKRQNHFEFPLSLKLSMMTLPGAIAGAVVAVRVDDDLFQTILGIVMIGVIITMFISPAPTRTGSASGEKSWLIYPALLAIGFYGGFIQVGVGFLFMAALFHLMSMTLVHVNMHKVFIVLIYTLPTLAIFFWTGNVNWLVGLIMGAGSALGGWWAAHISVQKGDKVIRMILVIAILIMSLKLFDIF
jgi:uncharacterized protein